MASDREKKSNDIEFAHPRSQDPNQTTLLSFSSSSSKKSNQQNRNLDKKSNKSKQIHSVQSDIFGFATAPTTKAMLEFSNKGVVKAKSNTKGKTPIAPSKNATSKQFPSRFDGPKKSPGFLLWQVSNVWQRQQRRALTHIGLTHIQFVLLASVMWLEQHHKTITQIQLAHHAKTDPMMTSQVVRTLVKNKWLSRRRHPQDSRAFTLKLTPEGRELATQGFPLVEEVDETFFSVLSDQESFLKMLITLSKQGI